MGPIWCKYIRCVVCTNVTDSTHSLELHTLHLVKLHRTHNRPATMLTACGRVNSKDKHSLLSAMVLSRIPGFGVKIQLGVGPMCVQYSPQAPA